MDVVGRLERWAHFLVAGLQTCNKLQESDKEQTVTVMNDVRITMRRWWRQLVACVD